MATSISLSVKQDINYPDNDGQPMADNTKQFRWITTIQGGLEALFRDMMLMCLSLLTCSGIQ